jgi:alpha-1,2-mannosyltransferase
VSTGIDDPRAEVALPQSRRSRVRRLLVWFGLGLVVIGVANLAVGPRTSIVEEGLSFDFDLNWVAAHRLVDGEPLYDRIASRAEGVKIVASWMQHTNGDPFSSYIGPPPTALLHTPFLLFDHDTAAELFGIVAALGMALAVVITAQALPRSSRLPASLIGLGVLLLSFPGLRTLELGQGHEFVMLGLAVGIWGASRERWGVAGVGLGIATVLKLSPALLLVYLVLRGHSRAAKSALVTAVAMFAIAAAVGRPGDLVVWARDVAPSVSKGSIDIYNQSWVAWVARLFTSPGDYGSHDGLGPIHLVAYAIAAGGTFGLWRARRRLPFVPLELGALIVIALLAGPLSWDHYFVWAVIPITLVVDPDLWRGRSRTEVIGLVAATGAAVLLWYQWVTVPAVAGPEPDWTLRVTSSPYVLATLVLLAVVSWLLMTGCTRMAPDESKRPVALGAARGVVAA